MLSKVMINVIVIGLLIDISTGQLINHRYYFIQNAEDNGYLKVDTVGEPCKILGKVVSTKELNRTSGAYRWQYSEVADHVRIELDWRVGLMYNEMEMSDFLPASGNCLEFFRHLILTQINPEQDIFQIEEFLKSSCLTGNGVDARISWNNCNVTNTKQHWEFHDTRYYGIK